MESRKRGQKSGVKGLPLFQGSEVLFQVGLHWTVRSKGLTRQVHEGQAGPLEREPAAVFQKVRGWASAGEQPAPPKGPAGW